MEIGALLRDVLRRTWVVALLVVLAAGGAWAATSGSKDLYKASVDFQVAAADSSTVGATGQYVANFIQAVETPGVAAAVAKATGVDVDDVVSGAAADQVGNSSFITVTFQSDDRDVVGKVATALAREAALTVAAPAVQNAQFELDGAKADLKASQDAAAKATAALKSFLVPYSGVAPGIVYSQNQTYLNTLKGQLIKAETEGQPTGGLKAQISSYQSQQAALVGAMSKYEDLQQAAEDATKDVDLNRAQVRDATKVLRAAQAAPLLKPAAIEVTSATVARIRAVMISAGIAAIIGFALLVLLAGLTAGRGRRKQAGDFAGAGAAPAPADSLLGGFMAPVNGSHAVAPGSPYAPPAAPPMSVNGSHDDLLANPPTSPTQAVRRRDVR